jgi:hypothetical protein
MNVEETRDPKDQSKAADDLQPLGDGREELFGGGMRHIVLSRKDQSRNHGDEQRELPP